jgi:hypothetical protein
MDRFNGADGVAPDGVIEFQIVERFTRPFHPYSNYRVTDI